MDNVERTRHALHALDPGANRESWIRIGMAAKAAGLPVDEFINWSRPAANFVNEQDCRTQWDSFKDGPVSAGTLFHLAFDAGWKDPAKTHHNGHATFSSHRTGQHNGQASERAPRAAFAPAIGATELWESCKPATAEHPYIRAKRGRHDGLRVVPNGDPIVIAGKPVAGWLVVPVLSSSGTLQTLQLIPPPGTGDKLNLPRHSFNDGRFVVGSIATSPRLFIVEGIGQAWASWSAAGCATVVCFGAGRMAKVAESLRHEHPSMPLVLIPDRGKEAQAASIAKNVRGKWVELPPDTPENFDANDYAAEHGNDELAKLLVLAQSPVSRYCVKSASDVLNAPPLRWMVRGVLPAEGLACIFGASGSGKSFLALDLCAAIASGDSWFSHKVKAAPVVYVALEGEAGFSQRIKAWQNHHGRPMPSDLRFIMQSFDLRSADDLQAMADAVLASGGAGGLLVIDTLNRAASGADENTSRDMGEVIDAAKVLQAQFGGLVLLVHHSGKDQSRGLRGHSSLNAALDASIEVVKLDNRREWRIDKAKDGSDDAGESFRLQVVEIGRHDDDEPITSCVVVPDDDAKQVRRAIPPKGGNQGVAWSVLVEKLRQVSTTRPPEAPSTLPQGCAALPLDFAIEAIRERLACDPKRKTERAQQALNGLQARGLIRVDRGYVWIP
jgi:hypothetical protein